MLRYEDGGEIPTVGEYFYYDDDDADEDDDD
jgi:hypothetical protein